MAVGVRLPEVFLEGILSAFKASESVGGVMLSYHRETAPQYVIDAPPGVYEVTRGHTGTSIRKYIELSVAKAREKGVIVEVEADHVSITVSSAEAVKRITGGTGRRVLSDDEVARALRYIEDEIREAAETGSVNFFTLDTCELVDYSVERLSDEEVSTLFRDRYGGTGILERYRGIDFTVHGARVKFDEADTKRLALKLARSIEVLSRMYRILHEYVSWKFGIEVAFDETPSVTDPKELFFLLNELKERGLNADFVAPNVGFQKREDYRGDLEELYKRVRALAEVAGFFGTLLSFHSGSGSSPHSLKGEGVHETIRRATGGLFKYKISGVYYELLMHIMSKHQSPRARKLYEEIYAEVLEFIERQVRERGELYDETLLRMLEEYREVYQQKNRTAVEAPLFRHYSFVALNLRRNHRRHLRESIVELYEEDKSFRYDVDREVFSLTARFLESLSFKGNARAFTPTSS